MENIIEVPQTLSLARPDYALTHASSIQELLNRFISEQQVRNISKLRYKKSLKQYFLWIEKKGYLLKDITRVEILRWKEELSDPNRKPKILTPSTIGAYLAAVRIFYKWCEGHKLYPNVADDIHSPKSDPGFTKQALTADQSKKLLNHFKSSTPTSLTLRNFAIVNLMLRTGLRTIEVVRMDKGDIVFKNKVRVLMIQGKGRDTKSEFVKLNINAFLPIAEYLESKGEDYMAGEEGVAIFTSESDRNPKQRLATHAISRIVKEGFRAIGINHKHYTAHSLRHTAATLMLRAGAGLERVQRVLRHAKVETTQGYVRTFDEERRLIDSPEDLLDGVF